MEEKVPLRLLLRGRSSKNRRGFVDGRGALQTEVLKEREPVREASGAKSRFLRPAVSTWTLLALWSLAAFVVCFSVLTVALSFSAKASRRQPISNANLLFSGASSTTAGTSIATSNDASEQRGCRFFRKARFSGQPGLVGFHETSPASFRRLASSDKMQSVFDRVSPQRVQHRRFSGTQLKSARGLSMKAIRPKPKVVCTGLGVVNGVGVGINKFWENLLAGRNVVDRVTHFDASGMSCGIACEVQKDDFNPAEWFRDAKEVKRNDPYCTFAVAGAKMALEDAGINPHDGSINPTRFGVVVGSGIGGIGFMEKEMATMSSKGPKKVSPYLIPAMISNTAPGMIAIEVNAQGPNHGVVSACATGSHAIGVALRYLENGEADMVVCGGSEASITPLSFAGFNALRAMCVGYNDKPKQASRPFDKHRAGFVMGEGSGILVLETEEHAVRRGATRVYGEVAGYGANCDAHHITAPAPGGVGLAKCLELTLKDAEMSPSDVAYINAHGTSTPYNDRAETAAFKRIFGEEGAKKLHISSTKSMTGHCLGGAGGIEACVAAKVLETGVCPPTINYSTPDPDCDLNYCPNVAHALPEMPKAVMSDTLGFGGHNAAMILRRYSMQRH